MRESTTNICILGAGSWAIALGVLLERIGHMVKLWEFDKETAEMLRNRREHPEKLPGIRIPETVSITSDIWSAFHRSDYVIIALPSQVVRQVFSNLPESVKAKDIKRIKGFIIVSKGIECHTHALLSDIIKEEVSDIGDDRIAVLSGPSHAEEVSRQVPTTVVAASSNRNLAEMVQEDFSDESFRVYSNTDVKGVELCGGVKNVIAIAAGICDGLGFGDNTKGALLTRGVVEITRLGREFDTDEMTFSGLAGMGDLITTCVSKHSRNRKFGELIASGYTMEQALNKMVMVAEGVKTAESVYELAKSKGVEMPITAEVYKVLYQRKPPKRAVRDLMKRQIKPERW
ncbi:MAG: NAD(P)H-dependent glycerol-3-phosphate dehydrogenase [Chitinivibrionales bacterium]